MVVFDNILYLEIQDAIDCGLGKDREYLYKEKSRGAGWGTFAKHPIYKNIVLIEFETLHPKKKTLVTDHFGNPWDFFSRDPIRKMVERDLKAESFYLEYQYGEGKGLPTSPRNNVVEKYTVAASWLNMLLKAQEDFRSIKKTLCITAAKFWLDVCDMIRTENIDLPGNHIRLKSKILDYKKAFEQSPEHAYRLLIHKQYGVSKNAKISDEVAEALLLELISEPNTDDIKTRNKYNKWARENSREQISEATVGNWRRKNDHLIRAERYGTRENYNHLGKQIIRKRPSAPLLLVEHDDNELDLYFQSKKKDSKGKLVTYYFNRFVVAVVLDPFNDYILGWAIGETYTKQLIHFAYLDAIYNIKNLTGDFYLPNQIRSDRFGLDIKLENDLAQFYQSLGHFTPAAVKVPRGKYIERSFGDKWHQVLSSYKNYSGTNITSDYKPNEDFIKANQSGYPHADNAPDQVLHFIYIMRHLVNEKTGLSKEEEWLEAFKKSEKSQKHKITDKQMLMKFGVPHKWKNQITARNIVATIGDKERIYDVPDPYFLPNVGRTLQLIVDPMDYSRVLVTDYAKVTFVAHEITEDQKMPSALADFQPGDRIRLNDRLEQKRQHMRFIAEQKKSRQDILQREQINIEGMLLAGINTKAESHEALMNFSPLPIENKQRKKITGRRPSLEDMANQM